MKNRTNTPPRQTRQPRRSLLWNLLTVLVLLSTGCLVWYFITIYRDPFSALNLFPPQPTPTVFSTITPTITPRQQPATWTFTVTLKPPSTRTRASTWTAGPGIATRTSTPETPTATFTPSISVTPMPAEAEIAYIPSTDIYPARNCDYLGVGGAVFNVDGSPLTLQTVQLGGVLGETSVSAIKLSGSAALFGPSGFEFELGTRPQASTQTIWIQLFDNTGSALTEKVFIETFDDCTRNLVKITFTRSR